MLGLKLLVGFVYSFAGYIYYGFAGWIVGAALAIVLIHLLRSE